MCGIVGIIHARKRWEKNIEPAFKQMLYADAVRGKDSTGVFKGEGKECDWRKAAVAPGPFFNIDNTKDFFFGLGDVPFLCGHNRWATRGKVENANAHPFEVGHITLVHNGTLWQVHKLPDGHKFDVDSHAVANSIAAIGIEKTAPLMDGAYALVWHDAKKETLNMLRNPDRPLWLLECEDGLIFYGSELGLLRWVADRNGFKEVRWQELPPYEWWSFAEGEMKPKIKKVEHYTSPFVNWKGRHTGFGGVEGDDCAIPFEQGTRLTGPVQTQVRQTASVLQFKDKLAGNEKGPDSAPLVKISRGEKLLFSINDFEEDLKQGGFVPVVGDLPFKGDAIIVKGNYSGDVTILVQTKNLFEGTVANISTLKNKKIMIEVRGIKESEVPDPHYLSEPEKEDWKKCNWRPDSPKEPVKNPVAMIYDASTDSYVEKTYLPTQGGQTTKKQCHTCSEVKEGLSVFRSSKAIWQCWGCYKLWKNPDSIDTNQARQEQGKVIH